MHICFHVLAVTILVFLYRCEANHRTLTFIIFYKVLGTLNMLQIKYF